jgi:hypothetical protein
MEKNWGVSSPLGRIIIPNKNDRKKFNARNPLQKEAVCDKCYYISTTRICPICHHDLSGTKIHDDIFVLSLIGAKNTGKTNFLTVLLHKLLITKRLGKDMLLDFEAANEETLRKSEEEYLTPTYVNNTVVDSTKSVAIDKNIKEPLIFTMRIMKKTLFGGKKISKVSTLVIFDVAGEDLTSPEYMDKDLKHIVKSDAFIFLIDPLQIPQVAKLLKIDPLPIGMEFKISQILDRLTKHIKDKKSIPDLEQISTPMAVVISKMDKLKPFLLNSKRLDKDHTHRAGFDTTDFQIVDSEVKYLLEHYNFGGLCEAFTSRFSDTAFLGVSALGSDPVLEEKGQRIDQLNPKRLEDPFLWILFMKNLIKSSPYL